MLVLTRRSGESVVIGDDVTVTVLEIRHDQVRLGVDAPRSVPVHRHEVYEQVIRENATAVATSEQARRVARSARPPRRPGSGPKDPGTD